MRKLTTSSPSTKKRSPPNADEAPSNLIRPDLDWDRYSHEHAEPDWQEEWLAALRRETGNPNLDWTDLQSSDCNLPQYPLDLSEETILDIMLRGLTLGESKGEVPHLEIDGERPPTIPG